MNARASSTQNEREPTGVLNETAPKTTLFVTVKVVSDSTERVDNGHPSPARGGTCGLRNRNCNQICKPKTVICFRDVSDFCFSVNGRNVVSS